MSMESQGNSNRHRNFEKKSKVGSLTSLILIISIKLKSSRNVFCKEMKTKTRNATTQLWPMHCPKRCKGDLAETDNLGCLGIYIPTETNVCSNHIPHNSIQMDHRSKHKMSTIKLLEETNDWKSLHQRRHTNNKWTWRDVQHSQQFRRWQIKL